MSPYRKHLRVAGFVFGLVIQATSLAAQGGQQARRLATPTSSDAAPDAEAQPALEPARSILRHLVGRWRVEVRFAGNFDGPPDAAATRIVDTLFDDLRLQWTEVEDDSSHLASQGVIGFDTRTARFYSTAVHSGVGARCSRASTSERETGAAAGGDAASRLVFPQRKGRIPSAGRTTWCVLRAFH